MTKSDLSKAMQAVDASENPFVGDGSTDFAADETISVEEVRRATEAADKHRRRSEIDRALHFANTDKVAETIAERKTTHGDYVDHARVTQSLKKVIALELDAREFRGQPPLTDRQLESIDMILHKIGRAVAGDSGFADHWLDIQGYARIAIDEVK